MLRLYKQAALYDLPNNKLSELMAIHNGGEGGVPINLLLHEYIDFLTMAYLCKSSFCAKTISARSQLGIFIGRVTLF